MAQDQTNAALQARKDSIMAELTKTEKQVNTLEQTLASSEEVQGLNGQVSPAAL